MQRNNRFLFTLILLIMSVTSAFSFSMGYHFMLIRDTMMDNNLSLDAYSMALAANGYTDIFQVEETEWLVDDDFCQESKKLVENLHHDQFDSFERIDTYMRQLMKNLRSALEINIVNDEPMGVLMNMGVSLHILQDFYAHSNWAELNFPDLTGVDDATYFDIVVNYRDILDQMIEYDKSSDVPYVKKRDSNGEPYAYGLFTNGSGNVPSPGHGTIHKDDNSRIFSIGPFALLIKLLVNGSL
ncbi:MAG: hypothetical protein JXR70_02260 [Spirochaetales bacterium]|nr:hypothetical protein [Spirochaetales bacterium]